AHGVAHHKAQPSTGVVCISQRFLTSASSSVSGSPGGKIVVNLYELQFLDVEHVCIFSGFKAYAQVNMNGSTSGNVTAALVNSTGGWYNHSTVSYSGTEGDATTTIGDANNCVKGYGSATGGSGTGSATTAYTCVSN